MRYTTKDDVIISTLKESGITAFRYSENKNHHHIVYLEYNNVTFRNMQKFIINLATGSYKIDIENFHSGNKGQYLINFFENDLAMNCFIIEFCKQLPLLVPKEHKYTELTLQTEYTTGIML